MAKKSKFNPTALVVQNTANLTDIQKQHLQELETNPKYSLEPDPTGHYQMSDLEKNFIKQYINFRNVKTAADICHIDQDTANDLFVRYSVQNEIRRINAALYQRRFASKVLSLDELAGYLTTMITDEFVPMAEQLSPKDKLAVIDTLLRVNEIKQRSLEDPANIMSANVDAISAQIKTLSVTTIKQLIEQKPIDASENAVIVDKLDEKNTLTPEEKSYLETLPTNELLKLVDETNKMNKGGKKS